jgi:hypothetical protein
MDFDRKTPEKLALLPETILFLKSQNGGLAYVRGNRIAYQRLSSLRAQEMTMGPLFRSNSFPSTPGMIRRTFDLATNLAIRLLARSLNLPEPLLHTTGVFVVAQVVAVETSVGRTLCPIRLLRRLQNWWRAPGR